MSGGHWDGWSGRNADEFVPGFLSALKARIVASILLVSGAAVFLLLYLAFVAERFAWFQNLAVVLVTAIVVPVGLVVMWVAWGLGLAKRQFV